MSQFHLGLRIEVRLALRAQGKGFWAIQEAMSNWSDDLPQIAAGMAGISIPANLTSDTEAIGDGTIWKAIIDFLKSPAGQALIQALLALLLGFLAPAPTPA